MMMARRSRRRSCSVALVLVIALSGLAHWRSLGPAATAAAQPALAVVEVDIVGFAFNPSPLVIRPNTTVRWTNRDFARHDVVGAQGASALRSPLLAQGESFEYTFTLPGTYDYVCTLHAGMVGRVVVEQSGSLTFPATGYTVGGPFLDYWRSHGLEFGDANVSYRESLALFGNPISEPIRERLGEREYEVQYFERARFEYHPEIADPRYQVLLGQLGRIIRAADPPAAQQIGATYFAETGHNLNGRFREYWQENGGLAVFGFPLSEEFVETLDGTPYRVQYFERARFEYHTGNQPPYDVLLGQFGREVRDR